MTEPQENPLMAGSTEYTAFISYSRTPEQRFRWVLELATKLRVDGVNVILDEWDLQPGQDKNVFMERMVLDPEVKKVLIICDKEYQEKADGRQRGVGTETQLISAEVYERVDQEKFIPVIAEHDTEGKPFMPKYLASRIYIDLSQAMTFEAEYQKLLRNIYGRPEKKRPPLGEPPVYLFEEAEGPPKSATIARRAISAEGGSEDSSVFIEAFFRQFLADMEQFRFTPVGDEPYDETMMKLIERMRPLRDSFIEFAIRLSRSSISPADVDRMHDNLEKVAQFQFRPWTVMSYHRTDWDNYRFICYELMLHLAAILIRSGRLNELAQIVDSTYFYDSDTVRNSHSGVAVFNRYAATLEVRRKQRLQLNRISVTADVIKARAENSGTSFDKLAEADLLVYYLTLLLQTGDADHWRPNIWFPHLSSFVPESQDIPILQRLVSRRYFERVRILFGVATPEELRTKIVNASEREAAYRQEINVFYYQILPLANAIPVDRMASLP